MMSAHGRQRPEVVEFARWIGEQSALTRRAIGEPDPPVDEHSG
ncbi:hypothetical protein [Mitsuaria sp. TWR114]|nr:hypothetical protein [Mitsuaria sp. TWR114]